MNNILIYIIFFLSFLTISSNGILMINEKDKITFNNLSSIDQLYIFCIVYTEIYLIIMFIYNILYYIHYFFVLLFSNTTLTVNFNCYKTIFLLSGIGSHSYLFFILVTDVSEVNENIKTINIIFSTNFILTILISLISCYFNNCSSDDNNNNNNNNLIKNEETYAS